MEDRIILHSDADSFFASVETALDPSLKGKAVAVCGSVEERHGIVLAKSELAKRAGVKTGMTVGDAKKRCPSLTVVSPHYDRYVEYSLALREIYDDYSDRVEPFGMDECWLDISSGIKNYKDAVFVSDTLKKQVKRSLGISVSVGISFNKVFAKLASDLNKPDGMALVRPEDYKQRLYPLPVNSLLGVGRATAATLSRYGIRTIGALAQCDSALLSRLMGKTGVMLWRYANGLDNSPVLTEAERPPVKSVGHGMTPRADLTTCEAVREFMLGLSVEIGRRLRKYGMRAGGVSIALRDTHLSVKQLQAPLAVATDNAVDIARAAYRLFQAGGVGLMPLRSLTVTAISLQSENAPLQADLFTDYRRIEKRAALDRAVDSLCERYGKNTLMPATLCGKGFTLSPSGQSFHTVGKTDM